MGTVSLSPYHPPIVPDLSKIQLADSCLDSYKGIGYSKVDNEGTPDRCEFWGLAKDNILGVIEVESLPVVLEDARDTLRSFIERSHAICMLMLSYLNIHLGLPAGTLASIHDLHQPSGDQACMLKMPPQPEGDRRTSLLAHTDFGSISMVWNILGGCSPAVQVLFSSIVTISFTVPNLM